MTNHKDILSQLYNNLNTLREREAKYAGNAPLELLNQIEDHQKAIDLTNQVITDEISQAEWREALRPLVVFPPGSQVLTNPPLLLNPAEANERRDLGILLNKVKTFWIEGVLEKSIHTTTLLELNRTVDMQVVEHPWERVLELPDQTQQSLPTHKKVIGIFEELNGAMLILGEPGSGKTTTLLELTRDLVKRVQNNESFAQPVPVIFNLSSWTEGRLFIDWLVAELSTKYQIPQRIGRAWFEHNRLTPLLDGLDEVRPEQRAACVTAINIFSDEAGLAGLVVCSRLQEYTALPVRLKLKGAIRLQPLTPEQVDVYLLTAGPQLDTLRTILYQDQPLRLLAQSPLMLAIMTLAYQNSALLKTPSFATIEARRTHLFDAYIKQMFKRKGKASKPYPDRQTITWLTWLAQRMSQDNQTIFSVENLQPGWIPGAGWYWAYIGTSRLLGSLALGPIFWVMFRYTSIWAWGLGLVAGFCISLIDGIRLKWRKRQIPLQVAYFSWQVMFNVLTVGAVTGLAVGLSAWLWNSIDWLGIFWAIQDGDIFDMLATQVQWLKEDLFFHLRSWLIYTVVFGAIYGLTFGPRSSGQSMNTDIRTVETLKWSWGGALRGGVVGLVVGPLFRIGFELLLWLIDDVTVTLINWSLGTGSGSSYPFIERLSLGVQDVVGRPGIWLIASLVGALIGAMFLGLTGRAVETKISPNQGIQLSLRNALLAGLLFGLTGGLLFWFAGEPLEWLVGDSGWRAGLRAGIITGLLAILWYGGLDVIQHYTLRLMLWFNGYAPLNYAHFLDYTVERVFLQKVGGGYIFIHRYLMEYFASLTPEDAERLSTDI